MFKPFLKRNLVLVSMLALFFLSFSFISGANPRPSPVIRINSTELFFNLSVNYELTSQSFLISNSGNTKLSYRITLTSNIGNGFKRGGSIHNPSSWLSIDNKIGSLKPGEINNVLVTINPNKLKPGKTQAVIKILSNDRHHPVRQIIVSVYLNTGQKSLLFITPYPLYDFGNVCLNTSQSSKFSLRNFSNHIITIKQLQLDNSCFKHNVLIPLIIPAFGETSLTVTFTPNNTGPVSTNLMIISNAKDNPYLTIQLTGTGVLPPVVTVEPTDFEESAESGGIIQKSFTIRNPGADNLNYIISKSSVKTGTSGINSNNTVDTSDVTPLVKGEKDLRTGKPVLQNFGGPDSYGYRCSDSNNPGGPAYTWNDISWKGILLNQIADVDDAFEAVDLSFDFPFYGSRYNRMFISSNGFITFSDGSADWSNYPLPSAVAPQNLIAGFWDDLNTAIGEIYYLDEGDKVTVQFNNVGFYSGFWFVTFQIVLEKNGTITFYYANVEHADLTTATVGIQNSAKDNGLEVLFNNSYLKNNLAVKIEPMPWLKVFPESGIVPAGGSKEIIVTLDSTKADPGCNMAVLEVYPNSESTSPILIPCSLTVFPAKSPYLLPSSIDFDKVWTGKTKAVEVSIDNRSGATDLVINSINSSNPKFQASGISLPWVIPAGSSAAFKLNYTPTAPESENGMLTIYSNSTPMSISFRGEGAFPPTAVVNPPTLKFIVNQFGLPMGEMQTFELSNIGGDYLTCEFAYTTNPDLVFIGGMPNILNPGEKQDLYIGAMGSFYPPGTYNESVVYNTNDPHGQIIINVIVEVTGE